MSVSIVAEIRRSAALAAPLIVAQLAQVSLGFIDTLMVGRLGGDALAAVALGSATFFPLLVIGMGVVNAVSPMVAQAFGAGRFEETGRAVRQGLWLATFLSVPAVLVLWNSEPLLVRLGQSPSIAAMSQEYLRAMAFGFLPSLGFVAVRNFSEGYSKPRPVMFVAFGAVALNVVADYVLMFGKLGFPALGLVGTGWASALVYWTMFLALALYVRSSRVFGISHVFDRLGRPDWRMFRDLLKIGLPTGVLWGIESGLFAVTAFLMGTFGTTSLASHQIAIQCASVTFMIPLGMSMAATVRVGQAIGRRDMPSARLAGTVGMMLGTGFMVFAAVAFWILPRRIVSLYLDVSDPTNDAVVAMSVSLLGIAAVFQVFDGLQATAGGALRGMKDTRVPMFVGLVSYWAIGLTTGYLLAFRFEFGGSGLWWGLVIGLLSASVLLTTRFFRLARDRPTPPEARLVPHADHDHDIVDGVRPGGDTESPQEEDRVESEAK